MLFVVWPWMQLGQVHQSYAEYKGVNADAFQLFYNGHRVSATDTPAELALEDDDVLHAELVA